MLNPRLNRRITIEQKVTTTHATYRTEVVSWEALSYLPGSPQVAEKFWAEVQDALPSRSESVQQGAGIARKQVRIRMRWRDDIETTMRVTVHGDSDQVYQIISEPAEIIGRKRFVEFVAERYSS